MKIRLGFVSNSSSTSFYFTNISSKRLTVNKFLKEFNEFVKNLCETYKDEDPVYGWIDIFSSLEELMKNVDNHSEGIFSDNPSNTRRRYFNPNTPVRIRIRMDGDGGCAAEDIFGHLAPKSGSTENFKWVHDPKEDW